MSRPEHALRVEVPETRLKAKDLGSLKGRYRIVKYVLRAHALDFATRIHSH